MGRMAEDAVRSPTWALTARVTHRWRTFLGYVGRETMRQKIFGRATVWLRTRSTLLTHAGSSTLRCKPRPSENSRPGASCTVVATRVEWSATPGVDGNGTGRGIGAGGVATNLYHRSSKDIEETTCHPNRSWFSVVHVVLPLARRVVADEISTIWNAKTASNYDPGAPWVNAVTNYSAMASCR